jgi:hypothetical protein
MHKLNFLSMFLLASVNVAAQFNVDTVKLGSMGKISFPTAAIRTYHPPPYITAEIKQPINIGKLRVDTRNIPDTWKHADFDKYIDIHITLPTGNADVVIYDKQDTTLNGTIQLKIKGDTATFVYDLVNLINRESKRLMALENMASMLNLQNLSNTPTAPKEWRIRFKKHLKEYKQARKELYAPDTTKHQSLTPP